MDFFSAQDAARRKTWHLVLLFGGALLGLIILTNLLVGGVLSWTSSYGQVASVEQAVARVPLAHWAGISLGVLIVVAGASLFKYLAVSAGGRAVAERAGGIEINPNTSDPAERRLLNVVAEMAIASGIPVPPVYLLDEEGINAFAAGRGTDDAVIGVTRGTLRHLQRDELQGVVGHEFSHILNGDTGINLRLIALLHGILFIGLIGQALLRGSRHSRRSNNAAPVVVLGLGFAVIGYAGTFFGNLIKAAVSRQREYLADAAAVQFTRNPAGIAEALKKIGGHSSGSEITDSRAAEISHMYFGQAVTLFMNNLMATHPPLSERIQAIEPRWDGNFPRIEGFRAQTIPVEEQTLGFAGDTGSARLDGDVIAVELDPDTVVRETGRLDDARLDQTRGLIGSLGAANLSATQDTWAARGLIYAMLLSASRQSRKLQLAFLDREADAGVPVQVRRLAPGVHELDALARTTLVSLAIPALKQLSKPQYQLFIANTIKLIKLDGQIDLIEWVMHRLLLKDLTPHFESKRLSRPQYRSLDQVAAAVGELLSSLARHGSADPKLQAQAFTAAVSETGLQIQFESQDDPDFARLNDALKKLRRVPALVKPKLIKAAATCVLHDGHASPNEVALLQGIGAALDCPLPPTFATRAVPATI